MPRRLLLLAALAAPAHAQDGTGHPACDAFLRAYAQCAATPGLPDQVRASITGALPALRQGFRATPAGRDAGAECLSLHGSMRDGLVQAYRCDFPGPEGAVPAVTPAPRPVRPAPSAEQQEAAKASAWTRAQNDIAEWRHFDRDLASYLEGQDRMPRPGAKPNPNNWYDFGVGSMKVPMGLLRDAAALPGAIPGVDEAGAALLAAMEAVDPVIARLSRYQTTREFKEDNYKLAREQHPALVSGMKAVIQAADAFGAALFDRGMARDEARVETLPKGSVAQRLLATSLVARRAVRAHDALRPRANPAPLQSAVATLAAGNAALLDTLGRAATKPGSYCTSYSEDIDTMVGAGRDLVRDLRDNSSLSSNSRKFIEAYNKSVDHMARCEAD